MYLPILSRYLKFEWTIVLVCTGAWENQGIPRLRCRLWVSFERTRRLAAGKSGWIFRPTHWSNLTGPERGRKFRRRKIHRRHPIMKKKTKKNKKSDLLAVKLLVASRFMYFVIPFGLQLLVPNAASSALATANFPFLQNPNKTLVVKLPATHPHELPHLQAHTSPSCNATASADTENISTLQFPNEPKPPETQTCTISNFKTDFIKTSTRNSIHYLLLFDNLFFSHAINGAWSQNEHY